MGIIFQTLVPLVALAITIPLFLPALLGIDGLLDSFDFWVFVAPIISGMTTGFFGVLFFSAIFRPVADMLSPILPAVVAMYALHSLFSRTLETVGAADLGPGFIDCAGYVIISFTLSFFLSYPLTSIGVYPKDAEDLDTELAAPLLIRGIRGVHRALPNTLPILMLGSHFGHVLMAAAQTG